MHGGGGARGRGERVGVLGDALVGVEGSGNARAHGEHDRVGVAGDPLDGGTVAATEDRHLGADGGQLGHPVGEVVVPITWWPAETQRRASSMPTLPHPMIT